VSPGPVGNRRKYGILNRTTTMTIEILYLTAQMQRWLNLQVARHLEAQATRLSPAKGTVMTSYPMASKDLGADGPGGSVGLDRRGMPDGYLVDETESIDTIHPAAARLPAAQAARLIR
jgi:hypothetical protein